MLPASVLMGMTFPLVLHLGVAGAGGASPASTIGRLYAANVLGGIAGAVVAGFVLLPALGSRAAAIGVAAVYLAWESPDPQVQEDFRRRAVVTWWVAGAASIVTLLLTRTEATRLWAGLTSWPAAVDSVS